MITNLYEEKIFQFMPRRELIQLGTVLLQQSGVKRKEAKVTTRKLFNEIYEKYINDEDWSTRLNIVFGGKYPERPIEFWNNNGFAIAIYSSNPRNGDYAYSVRMLKHIRPDKKILLSLAPNLHGIKRDEEKDKVSLVSTVDSSRLLEKENRMVSSTGLIEIRQHNRPIFYPSKEYWEYSKSRLPVKIELPNLYYQPNEELLSRFIDDLHDTFSWSSEDDFKRYLCYLFQPMLVHLQYGMFPGYVFLGPTKSGKNFLASYLPSMIYKRKESQTVVCRHMPKHEHETSIFLADSIESVYVVFDEGITLDEAQYKILDSLITSPDLSLRKLHVGNIKKQNDMVFSVTAVDLSLSNETEARVSRIELTQTAPSAIDKFNRKWSDKYTQILPSIFEKVCRINYDQKTIEPVSNRRPGFSILKHFLNEAFGLEVSFPLKGNEDDLLENICLMHLRGCDRTKTKYSLRNLQDYLAEHRRITIDKKHLVLKLTASLAYGGSTKHDPTLKVNGYQLDSNKNGFHITFKKEGSNSPRKLIIIEEINSKTSKTSKTE